MSYGGVYRLPPQPHQAPRYAPIPAQGDQPPRRNPALAMAVVLACWPTGLEHNPQQRLPSAANLPSVDEPPKHSLATRYARLESWRPPDPLPQQQRRDIAPLTLVYGDQPPPFSPGVVRGLIREAWTPPFDHIQRKELRPQPLVILPGDDPPPRSNALILSMIRGMWEPAEQPNTLYRGIISSTALATVGEGWREGLDIDAEQTQFTIPILNTHYTLGPLTTQFTVPFLAAQQFTIPTENTTFTLPRD